jgi:D-alanyl-D-alanine carboxypeptidase
MQLRSDSASALEQMVSSANKQSIHLMLASGYRSYVEQVSVYASEVKNNGQAGADKESARPGHSEHQTGLAADLEPASRTCEIDPCFADKPEGKWLAANAYKYGFIIRYQQTQESLTGYKYEPWHVRYIGNALANQIHQNGQTLEQFFGLAAYGDYPSTSYQLGAGQ